MHRELIQAGVSDPFDGDPDDFLEPDDEPSLGPEDPSEDYDEGAVGTEAPRSPTPEVPSPDGDSGPLVDYESVDPGLRRRFWVLVLAIKFTLLSLTAGLLFFFVEGNRLIGGQLLGFGLLLASYSIYRYRDTKQRFEASEHEADGSDSPDSGDSDATGDGEGPVEDQR